MVGRGTTTVTANLGVRRAGLRMPIEMHSPVEGRLRSYAEANRKVRPLGVVLPDTFRGATLALCGAGPTLADNMPKDADVVFACNSALTYLLWRGATVSAACGIDQTPMLLNEWRTAPDVPYYVASTCDPELIRHLMGRGRQCYFFHNAVGFEGEWEYYCAEWPPSYMVGEGQTVVARMIGLAEWMGFERIDVYGADCCFGPGDVTHANGTTAQDAYNNPVIMTAEHDGRVWRTRPDMLMAAVDLVRRVRRSAGRVRLIGDTLPAALLDKDETFLDSVCRRLAPGERPDAA